MHGMLGTGDGISHLKERVRMLRERGRVVVRVGSAVRLRERGLFPEESEQVPRYTLWVLAGRCIPDVGDVRVCSLVETSTFLVLRSDCISCARTIMLWARRRRLAAARRASGVPG